MENVKRKISYRLYPSKRQENDMGVMLSLHQRLYNCALEQRICAYKQKRVSIRFAEQCRDLTLLRKDFAEYGNLNAQSCQVTLKRLDLAFANFFRRVKSFKQKAGFPRFKSYNRYPGWGYKTHGDGWRLLAGEKGKNGYLRLSGIGHIKIRGKGRHVGMPKTCEVQHKAGKWYVSITLLCSPTRKSGGNANGIDWGLESFATIANHNGQSDTIKNPRLLKKELKKLKTKQRSLSRKKRGSNNGKKARKIVAKLHARVANKRKEFLHQTTSKIVNESSLIAVERLDIKNMSARGGAYKKGLNREILSAAPGIFHQMLKYKAEEAGIEWIEIPTRQVKPSQTCHVCGCQKKKTLAQRKHTCACGAQCTRDENAAKVILNWALFGNATGQELARCGGVTLVTPMKHETPSISANIS
jgi:putative transposase